MRRTAKSGRRLGALASTSIRLAPGSQRDVGAEAAPVDGDVAAEHADLRGRGPDGAGDRRGAGPHRGGVGRPAERERTSGSLRGGFGSSPQPSGSTARTSTAGRATRRIGPSRLAGAPRTLEQFRGLRTVMGQSRSPSRVEGESSVTALRLPFAIALAALALVVPAAASAAPGDVRVQVESRDTTLLDGGGGRRPARAPSARSPRARGRTSATRARSRTATGSTPAASAPTAASSSTSTTSGPGSTGC